MTVDFTFEDQDDARRYLGEVAALWTVWITVLFVVTFSTGGVRALGAIFGLVVTVWRTGPLQDRAKVLIPDEEAEVSVGFRGGPRERTFRKLAYGLEPLQAAVPMARASSVWFAARIAMLALTVLGFAAVVVGYLA